MSVDEISGTIKLSDGSESSFSLVKMYGEWGWHQWGARDRRLGRTVDVVDALTAGLVNAEVEL